MNKRSDGVCVAKCVIEATKKEDGSTWIKCTFCGYEGKGLQ